MTNHVDDKLTQGEISSSSCFLDFGLVCVGSVVAGGLGFGAGFVAGEIANNYMDVLKDASNYVRYGIDAASGLVGGGVAGAAYFVKGMRKLDSEN